MYCTSVAMDSALSLIAASCSNCSDSLPYWSKASWDAGEVGGGGERERERSIVGVDRNIKHNM